MSELDEWKQRLEMQKRVTDKVMTMSADEYIGIAKQLATYCPEMFLQLSGELYDTPLQAAMRLYYGDSGNGTNKVAAVREYRNLTGGTLLEGKNAIEEEIERRAAHL